MAKEQVRKNKIRYSLTNNKKLCKIKAIELW